MLGASNRAAVDSAPLVHGRRYAGDVVAVRLGAQVAAVADVALGRPGRRRRRGQVSPGADERGAGAGLGLAFLGDGAGRVPQVRALVAVVPTGRGRVSR